MASITLRKIMEQDRTWLARFAVERWGAATVVSRGVVYEIATLPGFIAEDGDKCVGVVTYRREKQACEIISIDSLRPEQGIGTLLIEAIKDLALQAGCTRLWLITTNDNLNALRFYQKRDFALVAVYSRAVEQSRKLKPEIPLMGAYGIPLRDELELEMLLEPCPALKP